MTTTAKTDTSLESLRPGGILLETSYAATTALPAKILDNPSYREKCTMICDSSQNGTFTIYDVNERDGIAQIVAIPVIGGTLAIYTHNHVARMIYSTFTPTSVTAGTVMIRGYTAGFGLRG